MSTPDPYASDKLLAHPDALYALREGGSALRSVHLMPQNVCNHGCSFCSYRMPHNKNSSAFDDGATLPADALPGLFRDFARLGVQGVEVTGGGEPMAYPDIRALWEGMHAEHFRTALVTNGTLMRDLAPLVTERMAWARVSIDAGAAGTYATMRRCPPEHFAKAWRAVRDLRDAAEAHEWADFRLGVGFVMDAPNAYELDEFMLRAVESGADNVRLSSTFSDEGLGRFEGIDLDRVLADSIAAEAFGAEHGVKVHNLLPRRLSETRRHTQDYPRCFAKDMLCVVEGEGNVYTCCTFTGSDKGKQGNILEHPDGFYGVWRDADGFRRGLDPRTYCQVACLYESRNKSMARLVEAGDMMHREFI